MRVFLGTADTASVLSGLDAGFRALGHETTTLVDGPCDTLATYDLQRGYELRRLVDYGKWPRPWSSIAYRLDDGPVRVISTSPLWRRLLDHDLFVFVYRPFAPEAWLFPLLRALGKRIACFFLGSDVRHISALSQEYGVDVSRWRREFQRDPVNRKVAKIRAVEWYADAVYSVPDQAGLQIRPYHRARLALAGLAELEEHVPGRARPKILHAPSREDVKGTSHVVAAVEALRAEGLELEFRLLKGVPRAEVLAALRDADILVDELWLHGPGVLSAEAMSLGTLVLTRTMGGAPVVPVTVDTLKDRLREAVLDVERRVALAREARAWARSEYAPVEVARSVVADVEEARPGELVPRFYLERYVLPAGARLSRSSRQWSRRVAERFQPTVDLRGAAERGLVTEAP